MPEIPSKIREDHPDAAHDFDSNVKNAEKAYDETIADALGKKYTDDKMAQIHREAVSKRNNAIMDHYNDLLKKISTGDNKWIGKEPARFLDSKNGGPGDAYTLNKDGAPVHEVNGFNRAEREEGNNLASGAYDHDSMRKRYNDKIFKLGGPEDKSFANWAREVLGKGPKLKFDKVLKDKLGSQKYNELKTHVKDMQDAVKSSENNYDNTSSKWNSDDRAKFEKASKNIDRLLKDLGDEWDKQRDKDNAMSGDASKEGGKPKTKTRLEMIYKIMSLLSVLGLSIFAYVTLEQYCANHTGCLKVQYSGSGTTQNNIHYCNSSNSKNKNKTVYLPSQCYCSQFKKAAKPSSGCECGEANACSSGEEPPWTKFTADNTASKNIPCNPADGSTPSGDTAFIYYSYQTMTPIDGALDIASKTLQLGSDLPQIIIHAAIVIGIILGVLLVLWIIYKVVANRKSSETLKIQTVGAPSTITKFGNRGYIGNLSRYSNYAYMGRCPALTPKPYIAQKFKF